MAKAKPVNEFMDELDHPQMIKVGFLREIISIGEWSSYTVWRILKPKNRIWKMQ
jgi:hypothetical protein